MAKADQYPEPRRAVPANFMRPSRTSKILTPAIVFATLVVLAVASIIGMVVAVSVFKSRSPHKPGESVAQVFSIVAASISVIYIIVHFFAVLGNEPVGSVRPPEVQSHGYCFIAARLGLFAWMIALIASAVVVSKPNVCVRWDRDCKLQVLDVVCASLAFVATGILLTALEACYDPFATPEILHIPRKITCRVSSFGDEIFERSTKTSIHDEESVSDEIKHLTAMEQAPMPRKPLPARSSVLLRQPIPGEFPQTLELASPTMQKPKVRGWGEEWKHLVQDTSSNKMARTISSDSISQSSTDETTASEGSSNTSVLQRTSRPRNVTPSSSISNLSRRSKLSTMRSVEFPDVPIPTQLRYLPPIIAPPHKWSISKTASLTQLLPVAEPYVSQRRASGTPATLKIMKPLSAPPPIFAPNFKRTTLDVKIPGAFIDYNPSEDHLALKGEAEDIEQTTAKSQTPSIDPVRSPRGDFELRYAPSTLDSRSRYRQHKRIQPSSIYSGTGSAVCMEAVKVQYVKPSNTITAVKARTHRMGETRRFNRLSLGDISPEIGKLWED